MNGRCAPAVTLALILFGSAAAHADPPPAATPDPQAVNCRVEVEGNDAGTKFHAEALVGVGRDVSLTDAGYSLEIQAPRVVNNRCHLRISFHSHTPGKNGVQRNSVADALLLPGRRTTLLKGDDFTLSATATIE